MTEEQNARPVSEGGSKDISAATLFDFQTAAQLIYRQGEVAHGDVRLTQSFQQGFELFFVKTAHGINSKMPTRERGHITRGTEEMTVCR